MSGMLVVIEGPDFCGKSTLVKGLAERLSGFGHDVITTREPGGTPFAETLRDLIFAQRQEGVDLISNTTKVLLMQAARRDHMEKLIIPQIQAGKIVICDRFYFSTYAYQVYGELLQGNEDLLGLFGSTCEFVLRGLPPAINLYLDTPKEVREERHAADGGRNSYDTMTDEERETISNGYEHLKNSGEFTILDGTKPAEDLITDGRVIVEAALQELAAALKAEEEQAARAQENPAPTEAGDASAEEAPAAPVTEFTEEQINTMIDQQLAVHHMSPERQAEWKPIVVFKINALIAQMAEQGAPNHMIEPSVKGAIDWLSKVGMSVQVAEELTAQHKEHLNQPATE